jgi:hypothetical protein
MTKPFVGLSRFDSNGSPFPGFIEPNIGVRREREEILRTTTPEFVVFGFVDDNCYVAQGPKQAA